MQKISFSLKYISLTLFLIFRFVDLEAQHNMRDSLISFPMIGVVAAYQIPGGDLAESFGNNINIGGVFQWKFGNNYLIGLEGNFLFGETVKDRYFLDRFKTPDGYIIDGSGGYAEIFLSERAMKFELKAGKIFPVIGNNKNSGLMATIGAGYFQHKIRIELPGGTIPYLTGEYLKGFNRLTNGLSLTEFIGYMNFSSKRLINFYAGFEFTQGFTRNRRAQNFDTGTNDPDLHTDLLFGIRVGWVFPLYKRMADKTYLN
jgi:hypothetical protein